MKPRGTIRQCFHKFSLLLGLLVLWLVPTGRAQTTSPINVTTYPGVNKLRPAGQLPTIFLTYNLLLPSNTNQVVIEVDNSGSANLTYSIQFGEATNEPAQPPFTFQQNPCTKLANGIGTTSATLTFSNQVLSPGVPDRYICQPPSTQRFILSLQAASLTANQTSLFAIVNSGTAILPIQTPSSNLYTHISTATSTVVKAAAGILHSVTVNTTAAGTITIFDNSSCSGTVIAVLASSVAVGTYTYDVVANTGICITTGAASDITVSSR